MSSESAAFVLGADRARRIVETAPAGLLAIAGETHRILYANTTLLRVLGDTDIIGRTVTSLFAPSNAATIVALLSDSPDADTDIPVGATAELITSTTGTLTVLLMANRTTDETTTTDETSTTDQPGTGTTIWVTLHSATAHRIREQRLTDARDSARSAASDAVDALSRSQDALGVSETARHTAETERTQIQVLASTLQRTLLPPILIAPPGFEVSAYYHHASPDQVGGDFYDLFPLDRNTWGFFLGDVSGKGAGAAAVTSLTRYALRAAAVFDRDPVTVLNNLNTVLLPEFRSDDPRFCTVLYGTITPGPDGSAAIALAAGGHPPAIHLHGDGTTRFVDTAGGQLVGALDEPRFRAVEFTLHPGDVLLLYTDGLTEAHVGPGRARYDDDGALHRFAAAAAPTTAPRLIDDLTALLHSFGAGLQDDVALLALGAPPTP